MNPRMQYAPFNTTINIFENNEVVDQTTHHKLQCLSFV